MLIIQLSVRSIGEDIPLKDIRQEAAPKVYIISGVDRMVTVSNPEIKKPLI